MTWKTFVPALVGTLVIFGCSQEAKDDMSQAGAAAGTAVKKTGEAVATDAKNAGAAVADKADEAKQAGENAMMTGKVRSAITTAADVFIEDLNVDTMDGKVVLQGWAKDAKSRDEAGKIAALQAGEKYTVENNIKVKS